MREGGGERGRDAVRCAEAKKGRLTHTHTHARGCVCVRVWGCACVGGVSVCMEMNTARAFAAQTSVSVSKFSNVNKMISQQGDIISCYDVLQSRVFAWND